MRFYLPFFLALVFTLLSFPLFTNAASAENRQIRPTAQLKQKSTVASKPTANKPAKNTSRMKNALKPAKEAVGHHSTFQRNNANKVFKYTTYKKTSSGHFDIKKRYDGGKPDGTQGAPHINKVTLKPVSTPHIQSKNTPGGVRSAKKFEIPK